MTTPQIVERFGMHIFGPRGIWARLAPGIWERSTLPGKSWLLSMPMSSFLPRGFA
jgi:hypothetical protein